MPIAFLKEGAEESLPEWSPVMGLIYGIGLLFVSYWLVQNVVKPRLKRRPTPRGIAPQYVHILGAVFFYFLANFVVAGLMFGGLDPAALEALPPLQPIIMTAAVQGLTVLGVVLLVQRLRGDPRHVGLGDPTILKSLLQGLAMYVCCLPAFIGGLLVWKVVLDLVGYTMAQQDVAQMIEDTQGNQRFLALLLAGLVIPFLEEFLFRGFIQNWLVRLRGILPGIWITSVGFAALHGISPFGYLLMVALAAGFILHWTGSLWAAFAVHAANNTINVMLLYFVPDLVL